MLKLIGHKSDVRGVAFAPDGRIVSCGSDKTVRVWHPVSGECLATIKTDQVVYAVAVSPDGRTIAYGGRPAPRSTTNFAHTCDFTGKLTERYEARTFGTVWRWNPATHLGSSERQPMGRTIWGLSFSADGKYLAAALRQPGGGNVSDGGGGFYWPVGNSGAAQPLPGEDIYAVAFAPTGHQIAVTRKLSVVFHESPAAPATRKEPSLFPDSTDPVTELKYKFTASWSAAVAYVVGRELAVVASNSFIEFVNPVWRASSTRVKTGCRTVIALATPPDGKILLAGGRPGAIEVYDTVTCAKRAEYDFGIGGVHALACAPDGLTFAAAGDEGLVVCDAG